MTCNITLDDAREIELFCENYFANTPINYFCYTRIYPDMNVFEISSNAHWQRFFWENNLGCMQKHRLKQGMLYWPSVSKLAEVANLAKSKFNIDHRYDINRKIHGYIEIFGFGTPAGCNDVMQTYFNHFNGLVEFGDLFLHHFSRLIKKHQHQRYSLKNCSSSAAMQPQRDITTLDNEQRLYLEKDLYLTRREIQCWYLTSKGLTAKKTSAKLGISSKSVESYLATIKLKLRSSNRQDLIAKAKAINLHKLYKLEELD